MVVAVHPSLRAAAPVAACRSIRASSASRRASRRSAAARAGSGKLAPPAQQAIERGLAVAANALRPAATSSGVIGSGIERRIAGPARERRVQLGGAHAERAHEGEVAAVHIRPPPASASCAGGSSKNRSR